MRSLFIKHFVRDLFTQSPAQMEIRQATAMVDFLITRGLIPDRTIRHYTIIREFEELSMVKPHLTKTTIIKALAQQLALHENTIWNVIKDYRDKYGSLTAPSIFASI